MRSWQIVAALAAVAVAVQCYGLYRVTGPPTPTWFPNFDKVEHALGFAFPVLLVLLALGLRRRAYGRRAYGGSGLSRLSVLPVAAIFLGQAVLSEIAQHLFYRFRTGDPWDVAADTAGIGLGVVGSWIGLQLPVREPVPR